MFNIQMHIYIQRLIIFAITPEIARLWRIYPWFAWSFLLVACGRTEEIMWILHICWSCKAVSKKMEIAQ